MQLYGYKIHHKVVISAQYNNQSLVKALTNVKLNLMPTSIWLT
jgi:hypothetical protein